MRNEDILSNEGVEMLTYWRLGPTERAHAQAVLDILDLQPGARVADLGSGTGKLASLCHELRPDLQWTLVNKDLWQLQHSPEWAERVHADMTSTGLHDGEFDAVVVAYALGYCNPASALEEAARLLTPNGKLLLHELYAPNRAAHSTALRELGYNLAKYNEVLMWAALSGFDFVEAYQDTHQAPGSTVENAWPTFSQFGHNASLFVRANRAPTFSDRRPALQFSGGKDSLACLYLLRPYIERGLPVYWTHTGDTIPETVEVVERARQMVPDFRIVQSDVMGWKALHGTPSDVTTAQSSWLGRQYAMSDTALVGRFECCWANLMLPMHNRMMADGIDMVIRGTKLADTGRVPASGTTEHYEVFLPLEHWSHDDVFSYLDDVGAPRSAVYDSFKSISAPECLHCTAWWDDGKGAYLKQLHPEKVGQYRVGLETIRAELHRRMEELDSELAILKQEN